MKITELKISVAELVKNYSDDGDGGVYGYDNRLTIRPAFQREFVYKDKQRDAVIETIRKGFPLNTMYWSLKDDGNYEMLDGQQRTISIGQYFNKDFSIKVNGNDKFFHNLTEEERKQFLDYELTIYICDGSESEKLEWFKVINIAGEVLTKATSVYMRLLDRNGRGAISALKEDDELESVMTAVCYLLKEGKIEADLDTRALCSGSEVRIRV